MSTAEANQLNLNFVERLSSSRNEPSWLLDWRKESWNAFEQLGMPSSRYIQVRGLDLGAINPVFEAESDAPVIPESMKPYLEITGDEGGYLLIVDGQVVDTKASDELKNKGVIFTDITTAIAEHPELVQRFLDTLETPEERITGLQRALFNCGPFLYVPKGVKVEGAIKSVQLVTKPGIGFFAQGLVIAEEQSEVTYIEEQYSPSEPFETASVQANGTRVHLEPGAKVHYAGVQSFNSQVYNFTRRWGQINQDADLHWTLGWLGGRQTFSHVENILNGPGAHVEDIQVFFSTGRQNFDLTSNLRHMKPSTTGEVTVKGVLKGKSQSAFWGLIRIEPGAQQSNAYQSERSLLVENGPRSNAIPSLEIEANDVRCTHAASASQIDDEQIFYLQSRGLNESQARKAIVDGFFEPTIADIPLQGVQDRLRDLVDRKWLGEI